MFSNTELDKLEDAFKTHSLCSPVLDHKKVLWIWTQQHKQEFQQGYCMHMTSRTMDFEEDVVLDTGETFSSIKNRKLLTNVHEAETPITMCADIREREIILQGEIIGLKDEAWLDEISMENVLCFAKLSDQYRIIYDNKQEACFLWHT